MNILMFRQRRMFPSAALYDRCASRGEADCANKLLSAMRYEFGGHIKIPAG
jgi:6-phosphogluconate dehydrogenase